MRYNRLLLISEPFVKKGLTTLQSRTFVIAKCDCGKEKEYNLHAIKSGHTKSCGCLRLENVKSSCTKHGMRFHLLYKVWRNMKTRCYNKNSSDYIRYGARGIKVCDEWRDNPQTFFDWALKNGYKKGLQLDRERNSGDYEPSNCRFVTQLVNIRNSRTPKLTEQRAKHIRILYKYSGRSQRNIAELYGVSHPIIGAIINNKIWV